MRRRLRSLLPIMTALAVGPVLGCGDNSDGSGSGADGGPRVDANDTDASPTETACGIVINTIPEGALGGPAENLAGIPVLFSNPDGSPLGAALTNVKGEASFDACVPDTTITFLILDQEDPRYSLVYSYAGVQPGDTTYYGETYLPTPDSTYATINVTPDQDIGDRQVTHFNLRFGCGTFGMPSIPTNVAYGASLSCQGNDPGTDILATIQGPDGGNGNIIGYAFVKNAPFMTGTPDATFENQTALPAWTFGNLDSSFVASHLPAAYDEAYTYRQSYVDGLGFAGESHSTYGGPVFSWGGTTLPDDFGETTASIVDVRLPQGGNFERYRTMSRQQPFSRDVSMDFSRALPAFDGVIAVGSGTDMPSLAWIAASDQDVTFTTLWSYFYDPQDGSPDVYESINWYVVVPGSPGSFTLPQIPAAYQSYLHLDALQLVPYLAAIHSTDWTDYQSVIQTPGFMPDQMVYGYNFPADIGPVPDDGDVLYRSSSWGSFDDED